MLWTYCINMFIAGLLGAATNELAIWWVLNKILPSKKGEIARRIRDIVATELISPDKMRDKLDDPKIGKMLQKHIQQVATEFLARDLPAPGILLADHMAEIDALAARFRESVLDEFSSRCGRHDFAATVLRPFLKERWEMVQFRSPKSLLSVPPGRAGAFAHDWIVSLERSESLHRHLRQALDAWLAERMHAAKTYADLLSPAMIQAIEERAATQAPLVIERFASLLGEASIRDTLTAAIMSAIGDQLRSQGILGDIKGVFVNAMRIEDDVRGICRSLPKKIGDHFNQPAQQKHFSDMLRKMVRESLKQDVPDEIKSDASRRHIVEFAIGSVWKTSTFEEFGRRMESIAEDIAGRSLRESVDRLGVGGSMDAVLDDAAAQCQSILVSDATRTTLARQLDDLFAGWKTKPLGRLGRLVTPEAVSKATEVVAEEVRLLLYYRVEDIAEESGVWDIVTASIENYDDKQLAGLITDLARSELKMVTYLGGAIGIVVGFIQTLMQSLGWF